MPTTIRTASLQTLPASTGKSWLHFCLALTVGAIVALLPTPHELSRIAQLVLAITALTATLWMTRAFSNGVASIFMMALMVLIGVRPALALSGFNAPSFWILLAVLFYGFAMQQTGLAQRVAYYILSLFPVTYLGILLAFFAMGSVLALGIPSNTVRTAIMVPIAWALTKSLQLADDSRGCALILLTTIEMAVVPGSALRYGSLFGPVVDTVFQAKHLSLTWTGYAETLAIPVFLLCLVIVIANLLILKPEALPTSQHQFAREGLKNLGAMTGRELVTAIVVIASFAFWSTDRFHHLPSFLIGMLAMPVFALAGIVREENIGTAVSWNLLLFLGGAFGLANVIQEYKITGWLAGYFVPVMQQLAFSPLLLLIVVAFAMLALRFLDPSGFIAIPVLFLPIVDVTTAAGIPPLVLTAPLLMAAAPFWFSYQNVWVAMGEGITGGRAYTGRQRVTIASVYALAVLVSLALGILYWKLTKLL